jgi:hypothetical protein
LLLLLPGRSATIRRRGNSPRDRLEGSRVQARAGKA